ncbi:hypothetical protein FAI40_03105 [Acetobacteraceae bacterium]|nr:hypothetical protein FAI40_03105 [Acetobacteraceae bacterium]
MQREDIEFIKERFPSIPTARIRGLDQNVFNDLYDYAAGLENLEGMQRQLRAIGSKNNSRQQELLEEIETEKMEIAESFQNLKGYAQQGVKIF